MATDVLDALRRQGDRLDAILRDLDEAGWERPSLCPGWSVADVVLHLAQTEEAVVATLEGRAVPIPTGEASTVDEMMEQWVRSERGHPPPEVHARWRVARHEALAALEAADPTVAVDWAAAPLRPATLATTRLSEHWIHTLDIAEPLEIDHTDTEDLRHIAWLAHRSLPYAFGRAGRGDPPAVRLELTSPGGDAWVFGPEDAACVVRGPAGAFCRVAARRLRPEDAAGLVVSGPRSDDVLDLIRTYA